MSAEKMAEQIGITAEVIGHELSTAALTVMVRDLSRFEPSAIEGALMRCARECKYKLTLADIIERIDDGRPGVEEAWGMIDFDENATLVLTDEMFKGFSAASPLAGDRVAARMAFKEAYAKAVAKARDNAEPVKWRISLGYDQAGREGVIFRSIEDGKILPAQARQVLAYLTDEEIMSRATLPQITKDKLLSGAPGNDSA